jgi:hypothetical protein
LIDKGRGNKACVVPYTPADEMGETDDPAVGDVCVSEPAPTSGGGSAPSEPEPEPGAGGQGGAGG